MFESMKGIAKGGKIAEAVSKSSMDTINWLIEQNKNLKTNDTLFTCRTYYFYAKLISHPTNLSENNFIKYMGALEVQAKTLLEEWLTTATGVFGLDDYIESFDDEYRNFGLEIKDKYGTPEGSNEQRFNIVKSNALEKVICDIQKYFDYPDDPLDSKEFKLLVGSCCEKIRSTI